MDAESNTVMVSAIEESNPSYWQLGNPDFYIVFFRAKDIDSRDRAVQLLANVKGLIMRDDRFADFKVGIHEGMVITEVDRTGKVCTPPVGGAINTAFDSQIGKTELKRGE